MEIKKKLLVFHPAIAPYRIDFFNVLNDRFNADFYFYRKNVSDQKFDQKALVHQLTFTPRFLNLGISLGYRDRVFRFGILHKLIKYRPDVILCSEYSVTTILSIFYQKLILPKSKVFTLCDDSLEIAKRCGRARKMARKIALKYIYGVILCNEATREWYDTAFPGLNTFVFPIIQNEERLRSYVPEIEKHAKAFKRRENFCLGKNYLYVGRFSQEKNLYLLIRAFLEHKKGTDLASKLFLIGDGELRYDLVRLIKELKLQDHVILPGRFEGITLYNWYYNADCFILPSNYEPFGAVVNEALIFGLPVICSDIAGSSCLINASNGIVFNPENATELAAILNQWSIKKDKHKHLMPYTFKDKITQLIFFLYQ